jgi:hypothetical protein
MTHKRLPQASLFPDAVASLRPGVEWTMSGDDVDNIIWHTEGVEPLTVAEVEAEVKRLEALEAAEVPRRARQEAYQSESDPLFFKWQRGEASEQEWLDKVAEIRLRYPTDEPAQTD